MLRLECILSSNGNSWSDLVVEVPTSNSSIQAGFAAYAQTVEHHGLLLTRLEKRIEDLEAANDEKDMIIEELIENKLELITTIEDLQQKVKELGENDGAILIFASQFLLWTLTLPLLQYYYQLILDSACNSWIAGLTPGIECRIK